MRMASAAIGILGRAGDVVLGKDEFRRAGPFRLEADLLGQRIVEAPGDDALVGRRHGRVEADQDLAGLHLVALLDEDLGDRAAALVLHLLDVAADHQRSMADDRAGEIDHRRQAADAEDQRGDREQADRHMSANAGADVNPVIEVRNSGRRRSGECFHIGHDAAASSRPFCGCC